MSAEGFRVMGSVSRFSGFEDVGFEAREEDLRSKFQRCAGTQNGLN